MFRNVSRLATLDVCLFVASENDEVCIYLPSVCQKDIDDPSVIGMQKRKNASWLTENDSEPLGGKTALTGELCQEPND